MMGAMRVFWCIAVRMVHAVQDSVCSGGKVRTALSNPGENVKKFFPELTHYKHLMGSIPVQKKTLTE